MVILDHNKLLTEFQCNALALLTLQEAMRLLVIGRAASEQLLFLHEVQLALRQNYSEKPVLNDTTTMGSHYDEKEDVEAPILEILIPKHVGQGMKYLEALKKHTE